MQLQCQTTSINQFSPAKGAEGAATGSGKATGILHFFFSENGINEDVSFAVIKLKMFQNCIKFSEMSSIPSFFPVPARQVAKVLRLKGDGHSLGGERDELRQVNG